MCVAVPDERLVRMDGHGAEGGCSGRLDFQSATVAVRRQRWFKSRARHQRYLQLWV